jgi:hypothetical protein
VLLAFLLPAVGGALVVLPRAPAGALPRGTLPALLALVAAAGLGLVLGAPAWALLAVAGGWALLARLLGGAPRDPERLLLRGLAAGGVFALVLVYGLAPGYLYRLGGNGSTLPPVQVTLDGPPPRGFTSETSVPLAVTVRNAGWSALGGNGAGPLHVGVRYLVTPERGTARVLDGVTVPVPGSLRPGETRTVTLPVRPPHWLHDAYLTWRLELADGRAAPLASGSHPGFRFINHGHRRLALDPENQLSALAARARAFARDTSAPPAPREARAGTPLGGVLGDVLDTLFFSPLYGEAAPGARGTPLRAGRPVLPALLHQYGLIGLGLGLWALLSLLRRAQDCAAQGDPGWRLLPITLALLAVAALFSAAPASYHALWAFFLLAGFLEGRFARMHPGSRPEPAPRRSWRLRIPLPGRSRAPRRPYA